MNQAVAHGSDGLAGRVALLHELANSIEQSNSALLASDWNSLQPNTVRQQRVCVELGALTPFLPTPELAEAANRVRYLNRVQAALLWRVRRTAVIFANALLGASDTYVPPKPSAGNRSPR